MGKTNVEVKKVPCPEKTGTLQKVADDQKLKICALGAKAIRKYFVCNARIKLADLGIHEKQRRCDSGHVQTLLRRAVWTESFTKYRYKSLIVVQPNKLHPHVT